jgi:CIC family chloride channel protein
MSYPGLGTVPIDLLLGVVAGFLGVAYNLAILATLRAADRLARRVEFGAAAIGAMVGCVAWFAPGLVGGGDPITQRILGGTGAAFMPWSVFVLRFALGSVSYAARTPGGLFAPLLDIGSQSVLFLGSIFSNWFPSAGTNPTAYAVVGMAAFFTAVVRAPLTGIILAIELTGSFTLLLPMLAACFASMLVATLLENPPIYDSLRWNS